MLKNSREYIGVPHTTYESPAKDLNAQKTLSIELNLWAVLHKSPLYIKFIGLEVNLINESCDEEFIILDSSGFTKGEKIFLEMEAKRFTKDFINYEFLDDLSPYENITKINKIPFYEKDSKNHKYSTKTSIKREFDTPILVTKYFTNEN